MIQEVYNKIFIIEIPLPNNPLKALNCYVVKGKEEALIVDTGFNSMECKEALFLGLQQLEVDVRKAKVVITHLHSDHSGLAHELYRKGATIYMSEGDGVATKKLADFRHWVKITESFKAFGLNIQEDFFMNHPGQIYGPESEFEYCPLKEGDIISLDDYCFQVVSVPGHTPDMINLYEPQHQIYFSGDHVLDGITPNIAFWGFQYPVILKQYLDSLEKIHSYHIKLMLPAHRRIIKNHQLRISQLIDHHHKRLHEIEEILLGKKEYITVEGVAKAMGWSISNKNWDDFPFAQKSFAILEAMSHLEYLVYLGKAEMKTEDGIYYFKLKK